MPTTKPAKASSNGSTVAVAREGTYRAAYKLPAGWAMRSFSDTISVRNGQVDPKGEKHVDSLLIAPNHMESGTGRIIYKETAREQGAISGKYLVEKGQVIYSKIRPYLMKAALAEEDCLCSADAYPISGRNGIQNEFLLYLLLSDRFTYYANSVSGRTGIPKVNREDLEQFVFACPPSEERKGIAAILGTWNAAIAKLEQLIAAKQRRKQGLMQELLDKVYDHSKKVNIGSVANEVIERNASDEDRMVLSCSKHRGFVSSLEYFKKQVYSVDRSNYKVIRRGQFGFPANHIEEGSIDLLTTHDIGLVSPIYVVFEFDHEKVNSEFMYYLFKTQRYRHVFRTSTNSSVDRRGSLRWGDFKNLWVPLPNRQEQDGIAELFHHIDHQIQMAEKYLILLTTQKRGLMQQLLTGAVRVKH